MRELRPAIHPLLDGEPLAGAGRSTTFPLSRAAVVVSVVLHLGGVYVVGRAAFGVDEPLLVLPRAEFIWLDTRVLPPSAPPVDEPQVVETPVVPPEIETESREPPAESLPPPRMVEEAPPVVAPAPLEPVVEAESSSAIEPRIDFEAERRRAAAEVVEQREREGNYLTFSIDDIAPPLPEAEDEPKRSIFDGGGGGSRGPTVGQLGQARTRFGHRVSALCNALTGGFSLMGWGSFCAEGDDEPSGLFPELMPAYLQMQPDCVETRPLDVRPEEESPFPTIKCRLVPRRADEELWAFPGPRPDRVDSVDGPP